jgi:hypothetical protein
MKMDEIVRFFEKETDATELRRACIDGCISGKWWKCSADGFGFDSGLGDFDAGLR